MARRKEGLIKWEGVFLPLRDDRGRPSFLRKRFEGKRGKYAYFSSCCP